MKIDGLKSMWKHKSRGVTQLLTDRYLHVNREHGGWLSVSDHAIPGGIQKHNRTMVNLMKSTSYKDYERYYRIYEREN